jgi:hypothetical protein
VKRTALILSVVLFLIVGALSVQAQPTVARANFLAIDSAFSAGQYDQVELLVLRELQSDTTLNPDETAHLCLLAGYSLIMLNRESDARAYFSRALDAIPNLQLDPVQVSPKFRMVFDDVAAHHVAKKATAPAESTPANALPQITTNQSAQQPRTIAPSSQLLNLVLPGAGQIREGHTLRGAAILTTQVATLGVFLWRMNELRHSRADYLAETDNNRIHETYNTYNRDYRWAWGTGIAAGVVYIAAQADLIRLTPRARAGKPQAALFPIIAPSSSVLCLQFTW